MSGRILKGFQKSDGKGLDLSSGIHLVYKERREKAGEGARTSIDGNRMDLTPQAAC